ncbi:hypothetical protein RhiirA4_548722 [Rhizophagus irregularis]|uniref:HTH CENPB-type domain-containing protein n=1 Tax=Rhizophagus irregularis TaxID=588596 RepID=A0A2I1H956_9GLOM|nr:hypothetical protein RhiirA4_548722 [Rhizophagus irregularis]
MYIHESVQKVESLLLISTKTSSSLVSKDDRWNVTTKRVRTRLNIESCANGWVCRFKLRNSLQEIHVSGKAKSAPLEGFSEERIRLRAFLAKYDEDIYNADETCLFFEWNQIKHLVLEQLLNVKKHEKDDDDINNEEMIDNEQESSQNHRQHQIQKLILNLWMRKQLLTKESIDYIAEG